MSACGWKISEFAAVLAAAGALAVAGAWDNERTIRRNIEAGYDTTATITGANEQHNFPMTFDGVRPRLLEETYSLDLAWRGQDGIERTRQKVPVSRNYLATLMVGGRVRLIPVAIKVLDEDGAVPTIAADAAARLAGLESFATWTGYGTGAAVLILAASLGGRRWRRTRGSVAAAGGTRDSAEWHIPPRLTIFTVFFLGVAGMAAYYSFKDSWSEAAIRAHGREATASITDLRPSMESDHTVSYLIDFVWRDASGAERHSGPSHVSNIFAQRIAGNGNPAGQQTTILYLEDDPSARPIIVADESERAHQDNFGRGAAAAVAVVGLALAAITVWRTRRSGMPVLPSAEHV